MQDQPGAADIMQAVIAFLREGAMPALPPRQAFEARVAANALELARREIMIGKAGEWSELQRLRAIFSCEDDLATLNARLCDGLADGSIDADGADITAHLRATTLEKLAVDQPGYAAYRRAVEQSGG